MGLDISLVKIERTPHRDNWLLVGDFPELQPLFSRYAVKHYFEYPDQSYHEDVYYYSEISYQRKGVTELFYKKIENDKCIVDKIELESMLQYIDTTHMDTFKNDFINKFVEGETFVIVGW